MSLTDDLQVAPADAGSPKLPMTRSSILESEPGEKIMSDEMIEPGEILIQPLSGWIAINWRELFDFRELLFFLAQRDVKIRYKQTALGVAWAVLQPLLTMIIFSIIFGRFVGLPSQDVPYPLFVFAGLIPWLFFSNGVTAAASSLLNQQHLLTKIYFPRLFVPTASIGAFLVDMMISLVLYAFLLLAYGAVPGWRIIFLPFLILATVTATMGLGLTLAALTVKYRDVRYTVPFLMQILMYISPVIYPITIVPDRYRWIAELNPMCGLIDAYRSVILGTPWNPMAIFLGTIVNLAMLVFGVFYFRKTERLFADIA